MLPAFMHGDVARDCVEMGKHLATASYVSDEMKALDAEAKKKGILLSFQPQLFQAMKSLYGAWLIIFTAGVLMYTKTQLGE